MADIQLTITIPESFTAEGLQKLNLAADKEIEIITSANQARGTCFGSYESIQGGETNLQFATRACKEVLRIFFRAVDYAQDNVRYRNEISAINPPDIDMDDGLII